MAEEIVDGQHASMSVNGQVIGGVVAFRFAEGLPPTVAHRPLSGEYVRYLPATPDWGTCSIVLYRNHSDPGQEVLSNARGTGATFSGSLVLPDATLSFTAFCESMPLIGGKRSGETLVTSTARIRFASPITVD